MTMTIRHAQPSDAEELHAILTSHHVVQGTMRLPHMALKTTEDRLRPEPNRLQLVALAEEQVIGFAELLLNLDIPRAAHAAELNMVAIREDQQGKGVARALIEELLAMSDGYLGLHRLCLTVWSDNDRAIRLYQSLGFEEEGRLRDFVRREEGFGDAIKMARIRERV